MGKKLTGNGLWESSRMMLPEHVERINVYNRELKKRSRIELDDQELAIIAMAVRESYELRKEITLKLFDEYEELKAIGIVEMIDPHQQRVRIDGEWFKVSDIVGVD